MGKRAEKKTNAMRLLDNAGIPYRTFSYSFGNDQFDGRLAAAQVGLPGGQVFKTLVALSEKGHPVVCCIPVDQKLDLKALAASSGCKRLELAPIPALPGLTGYVRGGVSPIGMKKQYPTFLDRSAMDWKEIAVSAGQRGLQLLVSPEDLTALLNARPGPFSIWQES